MSKTKNNGIGDSIIMRRLSVSKLSLIPKTFTKIRNIRILTIVFVKIELHLELLNTFGASFFDYDKNNCVKLHQH